MPEISFEVTITGVEVEQVASLTAVNKTDADNIQIDDTRRPSNQISVNQTGIDFYITDNNSDVICPFIIAVSPLVNTFVHTPSLSNGQFEYDVQVLYENPVSVQATSEAIEISIVDSQNYGTGPGGPGTYIQTTGPYWS